MNQRHSPIKVYPSAVDAWVMVMLYSGPALMGVLAIYFMIVKQSDDALICLVTSITLVLLNLLLIMPCRYTLTTDTLNLRCGIFSQTIPLERIRGAELSNSWLSGPALSLKRVRIQLDHGAKIVSPRDREKFIEDLLDAVAERQSR